MSLLNPPVASENRPNAMKYTVIAITLAVIIGGWLMFRYYPEKRAVDHFFEALVSGDTNQAYQLWKPSSSYKLNDFVADWGPNGYYGPVKSYEILRAAAKKESNGITINVAVSPFSPMPGANDPEKSRRTKTISLWVDPESKAISFSPNSADE